MHPAPFLPWHQDGFVGVLGPAPADVMALPSHVLRENRL
jgi:hypothetical protein